MSALDGPAMIRDALREAPNLLSECAHSAKEAVKNTITEEKSTEDKAANKVNDSTDNTADAVGVHYAGERAEHESENVIDEARDRIDDPREPNDF